MRLSGQGQRQCYCPDRRRSFATELCSADDTRYVAPQPSGSSQEQFQRPFTGIHRCLETKTYLGKLKEVRMLHLKNRENMI